MKSGDKWIVDHIHYGEEGNSTLFYDEGEAVEFAEKMNDLAKKDGESDIIEYKVRGR